MVIIKKFILLIPKFWTAGLSPAYSQAGFEQEIRQGRREGQLDLWQGFLAQMGCAHVSILARCEQSLWSGWRWQQAAGLRIKQHMEDG